MQKSNPGSLSLSSFDFCQRCKNQTQAVSACLLLFSASAAKVKRRQAEACPTEKPKAPDIPFPRNAKRFW